MCRRANGLFAMEMKVCRGCRSHSVLSGCPLSLVSSGPVYGAPVQFTLRWFGALANRFVVVFIALMFVSH